MLLSDHTTHYSCYRAGTAKAFKPEIQLARPHSGQMLSAQHVRQYLHSEKYPSEITESHANCGKVQDAYSLRCTPQVRH